MCQTIHKKNTTTWYNVEIIYWILKQDDWFKSKYDRVKKMQDVSVLFQVMKKTFFPDCDVSCNKNYNIFLEKI